MSQNGRDVYLESRVLSADPLELVRLLYHGCTDAVREARRRLQEGDIAGRSRAISNAIEVLTELATSLDHTQAEISRRLSLLYDYMQRRLIDANIQQQDGPLAEVLALLATLDEGWEGVQEQTAKSAKPATQPLAGSDVWSSQRVEQRELATASHAWSF
jgi:flagellar protein FliS